MKPQIIDAQSIVIGSGAGGATTAVTLAQSGIDVLLIEEGNSYDLNSYGMKSTQAMPLLYRNRGMTPILGSVPIGYVEGQCLGGSTEINSGLWQRLSAEISQHWESEYGLIATSPDVLKEHYEWAENLLHVSYRGNDLPASSNILFIGAKKLGWKAEEIPRAADNCQNTNTCATGCPKGAKQGMSRNLIPLAQKLGVRILTSCRAISLVRNKNQITGIKVLITNDYGQQELALINAENIFICCGPMQSPALLKRSGIQSNIGKTLSIHPMLKVAALFKDEINASQSVLPLVQIKEFWPEMSLGGSFFSLGHLAMTISDNWEKTSSVMTKYNNMATYYVGVTGTGKGTVDINPFVAQNAIPRYELSKLDLKHLSQGFSRLCTLLFAAGAQKIYPSIQGIDWINNEAETRHWLDQLLPKSNLSLTTVHAFSSIPTGEFQERCAANSFGKITGYKNLYVNDASILPNSPATNPQATIMALARRNALHFISSLSK